MKWIVLIWEYIKIFGAMIAVAAVLLTCVWHIENWHNKNKMIDKSRYCVFVPEYGYHPCDRYKLIPNGIQFYDKYQAKDLTFVGIPFTITGEDY